MGSGWWPVFAKQISWDGAKPPVSALIPPQAPAIFNFGFKEPSLYNRDLSLSFGLDYQGTSKNNARYNTGALDLMQLWAFRSAKSGFLTPKFFYENEELTDVTTTSAVITGEAAEGDRKTPRLGLHLLSSTTAGQV